jgi:uncharacterized protein
MHMAPLVFVCDAMLGTLARWLRFAGFDTVYAPDTRDAALVGRARAEGRWLLTRDRGLAARAGPRVVLLRSTNVRAQLAEVRGRLPLVVERGRYLSRCSCCNSELREIAREEAAARVPPYVAANASRFFLCPGCRRIYWPGTHPEKIERQLEALFGTETVPVPEP